MHISSCLHPVKVFNKYTNEVLYVPCGKCASCANTRAKKWIDRLNQESLCWKYTYNLYLDYDDENVPLFKLVNGCLQEQRERLFKNPYKEDLCVPLSDLIFKYDYERDYLYNRCTYHDGLYHGSVYDIQKFKKRLNRNIQRQITGKYNNFRSAITLEYGPTTFRPHYHGILFFNDDRIAKEISQIVSSSWKFGHSNAEPAKKGASAVVNYVAQYISRPTHLPAFHAHHALSPFFITSRHPPIGSLFESTQEIREIFFSGSVERSSKVVRDGKVEIVPAPLSKSFENRLYPKCSRFSSLSDSSRVELYRCLLSPTGEPYDNFTECHFQFSRKIGFNFNDSGYRKSDMCHTWLHDFWFNITDGFSKQRPIYDLYCKTKRIYYQSLIFGISFNEYLKYIFLYYQNKAIYQLKKFYEFQNTFTHDFSWKDLIYAYPDYVDSLNRQPLYLQEFLNINKCREFRLHWKHSEFIFEDSHKRSKQNGYLEKLSVRDSVLSSIINKFNYAKKRYEINEAFASTRAKRLRFVTPRCEHNKFRRTYAVLKYPYGSRW